MWDSVSTLVRIREIGIVGCFSNERKTKRRNPLKQGILHHWKRGDFIDVFGYICRCPKWLKVRLGKALLSRKLGCRIRSADWTCFFRGEILYVYIIIRKRFNCIFLLVEVPQRAPYWEHRYARVVLYRVYDIAGIFKGKLLYWLRKRGIVTR